MSDFIQGFTENIAHHAKVTLAYGQDLTSNASRTMATTMDLNSAWRGPGYNAASTVGDNWQSGVRPHHERVNNRSTSIGQIGGHYEGHIANDVQTMNGLSGPLTA
jgi:hypothetical protein